MPADIKECILCKSKELGAQEVFSFKRIKDIWKYSGIDIEKYLPDTDFCLKECFNCGLWFFEPQTVGSSDFYNVFQKEKKHKNYYHISWDHKAVLRHILDKKINSVLDYGCGTGIFLRSLPKNIIRTGIDFNADNFEDNNLRLTKTNLLDFSSDKTFEAVACVQVLEHLAEIRKHIAKMISLTSQGGYLFLSVPNKNGVMRLIQDKAKPLDFPPHHLTRWSKKALESIAQLYNLKIIDIIEEPLSFIHFKWLMQSKISLRIKNKIFRKIILLNQLPIVFILYPFYKQKILGHSILAIYAKN